jgi:thiol-disulfide isomerase/thioredoxin
MIKILNTALLAFLLTACSAPEETENKESTTLTTEAIQNALIQNGMSKKQEPKEESKPAIAQNVGPTQATVADKETALKTSIFTIKTIDGKEIHVDEVEGGLTFQEFKDKSVMVIFFGYRCPPCLAEIPALIELTKKKHPDLEIIAIEVQGLNSEKLKAFQTQKEINYNLAVQTEKNNSKFLSYIAAKAQWGGSIPFLIAFDPKGEVKVVHVGGLRYEQLDMIYKSLSDKK